MAATQPIPPYEHIQTHQFPFPSGNHEKKTEQKKQNKNPKTEEGREPWQELWNWGGMSLC